MTIEFSSTVRSLDTSCLSAFYKKTFRNLASLTLAISGSEVVKVCLVLFTQIIMNLKCFRFLMAQYFKICR